MAKYAIIYNNNLCDEKDAKGRYWCFTLTEAQAIDRVESLAKVGIYATYEPITETHWVNNWVG